MSAPQKENKRLEESPTKQRTPLQLTRQKNVGIYFAQSKNTIAMASNITDSSESNEDPDDTEFLTDDSDKKRKRSVDPLTRKLAKIRKTFDGNITFPDEKEEEEEESAQSVESQNTVSSEKVSHKPILKDSSSSNIEVDIKNKTASAGDSNENKENIVDTQNTDVLESLDDLFEDEWSYKKETPNELDALFENEWCYGESADINFDEPKRCVIIDIIWEKTDITLTVKDTSNDAMATVKCFGIWRYTKIEPGEFIVIKARKESSNKHWTVDNESGWIINQPDTLISGTSVVGALFCNRRSVLQEKFRQIESLPYYEGSGQYMLTGSLTHELLQTVLDKEVTDMKQISALLDDILKSKHAIQMMYSANVSSADCKNLMRPSVPQIYKFVQRYIKDIEPEVPDQNYHGKIEKICDIEENVWLPSLGLKGKIDLTVEVSNKLKNKQFSSVERKILPLEIKTGRATFSNEHQGQLILYTMMMNMTNRKTESGLLLYLRENIMKEIKGSSHAQRDLITLRNTVAYYTTREPTIVKVKDDEKILSTELPKPINHFSCSKCPYNTLCSVYLTEEDKKELYDGHNLKTLSEKVTSHLSSEHIEYVMKWVSLMQLEENTDNKDIFSWSDVWTLKPSKREKRGSCISHVNLLSVVEKYGRFLHKFQKPKNDESDIELNAFDFCEGEYVIISTNNRINVVSGFIDTVVSNDIFILCEKDITKIYKDKEFHIDKATRSSFLTHNLGQLGGLLDDHEICSRLRKIVIDRHPATFTSDLPARFAEVGKPILQKLNKNQRQAVIKACTMDNYLLIKGFPGTGKTQTLVALIELLAKLDMSVLVTAHTNSALDNILIKLLDRKVDFIRLGSSTKVHPLLIEKIDEKVTAKCDSPESLHTLYCSKKVVGVTCYGATHPHLSRRKFDICIVDESTQVLQPTILRPLYCASKFVLVGDPEQLPPIAKNNTARKMGINESLFTRLDADSNTVALTQQYRMNNCIMNIANRLTYNGQLQVGDVSAGSATMPVTNVADFEACEKWVRKALSLRLKNSVILLNTSATHHLSLDPSLQVQKGKTCNYWEAGIVLRLTEVLKNVGIDTQSIGIIAPYRAQVQLLRSIVSNDIEVNTVDQYQGRDKSVIIYSCSKSISKDINIPEFDILEDQQRLTVAVTRAKHKLIIVGDVNTLERYSPFKKLIDALKTYDRIYDLKEGEDDFCFEDLIRPLY